MEAGIEEWAKCVKVAKKYKLPCFHRCSSYLISISLGATLETCYNILEKVVPAEFARQKREVKSSYLRIGGGGEDLKIFKILIRKINV